ncbi:MAG: hypothetical protein R3C42_09960 [Parvularculaceae bacterium]
MLIRALLIVAALLGKEVYSQELKQFKKNKDQLSQLCSLAKKEAHSLIEQGLISTEKLNWYLRSCADKSAPLELDLSNMNFENNSRPSQSGVLEKSKKTPVAVQPSNELLDQVEVASKGEMGFNSLENEIIASNESTPFAQGRGSLRQSDKEQRSQLQEASAEVVMICCKKREYSYLKYCRGMVNQMVAIPRLEYLWLQSKTQEQALPEKQIIAAH